MRLTILKEIYNGDPSQNREQFIGGSDAGAVLGLNPWKSAYTLFCEKTGKISAEVPDNDALRAGRDLEEYVARRFCEETGKKVKRDNYTYYPKEFPFMRGHIDRRVYGENAILECKTAGGHQRKAYEAGEFPKHYYIQCLHYMAVTGAKRTYLAVFCFPHFYMFTFDRDEEEIKALISREAAFWNMVERDTWIDEADGSDSTTQTISTVFADSNEKESLTMPGDLADAADQLEEITATINALTEQKREIENRMKMYMEDAETMLSSDWRITWKTQKKNMIDTARLKKERPDIFEHYKKETTSRVFRRERIDKDDRE